MANTIEIIAQHLSGNDPEGFDVEAWTAHLAAAYRAVALAHYPNAVVSVEIDVQDACGDTRPVTVTLTVDGDDEYNDDLRREIEVTENYEWERHSDEFYI